MGHALSYLATLLIISIGMVGGLAGLGYRAGERNRAQAEQNRTQTEMRLVSEVSKAVEMALTENEGSVSLHTSGTDEASKVARAATTLVRDTVSDRVKFENKLHEIDFPNFMTPSRLARDPNFSEAFTSLDAVVKAVSERDQLRSAAYAKYRKQLTDSGLSQFTKHKILAQFDAALASTSAYRAKQTSLEMDTVNEFRAQFRDLSRTRGTWNIEDDQFVFDDQGDLNRYRSHLDAFLADEKSLRELDARRYLH